MKHSIGSTGHDLRPHPSARAGPPVSTAGRWWIGVTVLGIPLLALALLVFPARMLAHRLPDEFGDNGLVAAAIWGPIVAVAFALLLRAQFGRGADAPAALWGWVVPAGYLLLGTGVGSHLTGILANLDEPERVTSAGSGLILYGSMILGAAAGALLAQRVVEHLPRAAAARARAAWVETVPATGLFVAGLHLIVFLLSFAVITTLMTWADGDLLSGALFGAGAGAWVVVVQLWMTSVRVAVTPSGVRVTQGIFGLVSTTRTLPLADIASADAVDVTARRISRAMFCGNFKLYAYRPGPALRLQVRSGPSVTVGLRSHAQARQAADLITTWQMEQAAV